MVMYEKVSLEFVRCAKSALPNYAQPVRLAL